MRQRTPRPIDTANPLTGQVKELVEHDRRAQTRLNELEKWRSEKTDEGARRRERSHDAAYRRGVGSTMESTTGRHSALAHAAGKLDRSDGPAIEYRNGRRAWYRHGKRHREDGPALESPGGERAWWIDGEQLTPEQFELWRDRASR